MDNEKMAKRKIKGVEIKVKYYNGDYRMQIVDVDDVFPLVKFQEKIIDLIIDVAIECKKKNIK